EVGLDLAEEAAIEGVDLIGVGEMGIGNTTASSAITAVLTGAPLKLVTGRGTGLDDAGLKRKIEVIERAILVNRPDPQNPLDVLMKVGGLEIAATMGLIVGAAARRIPVVIDGFISTVGAFVAVKMKPSVKDYLFASHESMEGGHRIILREMELSPLLDLNLRLGEGTGSALATPLIDASLKILMEMATFGEAGVSERER
ncbi:MAG TPA: nicotinate-nucleotide--dimethylbenzimidazole phosphoribosyltransferase, partial [Candidatus Manganitrophaceae bacterium]|nr:nicotinate-nucleotide--dimethylbenzimidazole phosphoribosyltransferase [Candidatus Manganitrophaceae bacterium]